MRTSVRVRLRGTSDRMTLYEIARLTEETERRLNETRPRETMQLAGKTWHKAAPVESLVEGEPKVIEFPDLYAVLLKKDGEIFAFNNACPHLRLPFFVPDGEAAGPPASTVEGVVIKCRWHESCFDLATGEIVAWAVALDEKGRSEHTPMLGDISKNRAPLDLIPWREEAGHIWLALE